MPQQNKIQASDFEIGLMVFALRGLTADEGQPVFTLPVTRDSSLNSAGVRAGLLRSEGKYMQARREVLPLTRRADGKSDSGLFAFIGETYSVEHNWIEALAFYETAIRLNPSEAEYSTRAAKTLIALERFAEAEKYAHQACELDNESAEAFTALGLVLVGLGRWVEAIPQFETALKLDPNEAVPHAPLGTYYYEQGNYQLATKHISQAMRHGVADVALIAKLADIAHHRGDLPSVERALLSGLECHPDHPELLMTLTYFYKDFGNIKKAKMYAARLVSLYPEDARWPLLVEELESAGRREEDSRPM